MSNIIKYIYYLKYSII